MEGGNKMLFFAISPGFELYAKISTFEIKIVRELEVSAYF